MFLGAHLHHVLRDEKGRAFCLVGAHYARAARAAFKEADRCCGTRTAGVVLKLCVMHVRPSPGVLPLNVLHFIFLKRTPLCKTKPHGMQDKLAI